MADDDLWRRRFQIFMLVRLLGLGVLVLGVVIALTDLVQEDGSPLIGAIVALMGGIDAVFAPRVLKKAWEQQDRDGPDRTTGPN